MSEPYIGEIRMVGFNFNPRDWALCDGHFLDIRENQALYALIGTTYGGDGRTTFAVPDLRGRVPMHLNSSEGYFQGVRYGAEEVTITQQTMALHAHSLKAELVEADQLAPQNHSFAIAQSDTYSKQAPNLAMSPIAISDAGGNQPHNNMQPYQTVNFIISLTGLWPSRT